MTSDRDQGDPNAGSTTGRSGSLRFFIAFLAITALGGGAALVIRPDGGLLGTSTAELSTDLFRDFRWPGALLFTVFGLGGSIAWYGLGRPNRWATRLALVLGSGQVVWILVQTVLIRDPSWLQLLFFLIGILITGLAARAIGRGRRPE